MESSVDDSMDGIFYYAQNLLKSFMILLDSKDAVESGNGEHLALVQKQMLLNDGSDEEKKDQALAVLDRFG